MDSISHRPTSSASDRLDPYRHRNVQSEKHDQCCRASTKVKRLTQSIPATLLSWWRLWLTAVDLGLGAKSSAKWLEALKLAWAGLLAVTQKDKRCEIFVFFKLVRLVRGDCYLRFPQSIAVGGTIKDIVDPKSHETVSCKAREKTTRSTWDGRLFKNRKFEDRELFEIKEELDIDRDDLEYFLEPDPSPIPSWKVECIRNFCSRPVESHPEEGSSSDNSDERPARAWVDSRVSIGGSFQDHVGMFPPSTLYNILKEIRPREPAAIEAYRQLIHVTHLDDQYIRALAKAVWIHQAGALRDGIYKHIDRQASLGVYIPYPGFKVFQFECHLPYLALRWIDSSTRPIGILSTANGRKSWTDLSYLGLRHSNSSCEGAYAICELHSSLVVSGWDEAKWTAYGFTNADLAAESETLNDEENKDDKREAQEDPLVEEDAMPEEDDPYATNVAPVCLEDRLASDGKYGIILQEHPVWDPRLYFLQLTDFRLRIVRQEWSYLVCKITASVTSQNDTITYPISSTPFSGTLMAEKSLAKLSKTMNFLNELHQAFQVTTRTCERFLAPDGDHTYFYNEEAQISSTDLRNLVASIRYSFRCLTHLERRLASLEESCQSSKAIVSALIDSLCCILIEKIDSCVSSQHHKENVLLNKEANALAREANMLTSQANAIAVNNRTVAAANNLNAALMVNMNQFMTPVVVVVGYFSIEGEILGFRKTAKSFLVSVAILFFVLYLVNILIYLLRHHFKSKGVLTRILTGQLDQLLLDKGEPDIWSLDRAGFSGNKGQFIIINR